MQKYKLPSGRSATNLLLTVVHRFDYDGLIVLDKGEKEDGIFRTMCLKSGTFAKLEAAAKAKAERDAADAGA